MAKIIQSFGLALRKAPGAWDAFWFTPASGRLLGLMRIFVGLSVVYTHAIWSLELETFFGREGVLPAEYSQLLYGENAASLWSHFFWIDSMRLLWVIHGVALVVMVLFTLGLWTRVTAVVSYLFLVSYAHRATGALFGLDQINGFLLLYLAIGPSGAAFSLDDWLRRRRGMGRADVPSIGANVAQRLIQVHLCVVYLFAGMGKLQGTTWWNGEAIWGAIASADYQTWDVTWLAGAMWLINLVTLVSVAWEVSYPFLIWNRTLRPFYLAIAVLVHLGIGALMGMITFGVIMIIANMAFLPSDLFGRAAAGQGSSSGRRSGAYAP